MMSDNGIVFLTNLKSSVTKEQIDVGELTITSNERLDCSDLSNFSLTGRRFARIEIDNCKGTCVDLTGFTDLSQDSTITISGPINSIKYKNYSMKQIVSQQLFTFAQYNLLNTNLLTMSNPDYNKYQEMKSIDLNDRVIDILDLTRLPQLEEITLTGCVVIKYIHCNRSGLTCRYKNVIFVEATKTGTMKFSGSVRNCGASFGKFIKKKSIDNTTL